MNQITPLNSPDFVPADGLDEAVARPASRPLLLLVGILAVFGILTLGAWSSNRSPQPPPTGPYENGTAAPTTKLLVHVAGAVRRPGLYQLPADARVNDAVKRAGALPNADVNALNLAAWAEDGSRIEVPLKTNASQQTPRTLIEVAPEPGEKKPEAETKAQTAPKAAATLPKPSKTSPKPSKTPPRVININRASLDELTLLPGIGPAMAQRIVDYRKENGTFSSIDDLDAVKGIGEKKLEKLRPWVTVK